VTAAVQRHQAPLVYMMVVAFSLYSGLLVVRSSGMITMSVLALLGLAGVVILVNLPSSALFLGWLFLAPIFQTAADTSALGRGLTWALYIGPALVLAMLTILRRRNVPVRIVDYLPGVYVAYVLAAILLTTSLIKDETVGTAKAVFTIQVIGAVVYYFLTFGPGRDVRAVTIVGTLMIAGLVQGLFALAEITIGWNLWGYRDWQNVQGRARAVSTLANPDVLGLFLGASIVTAVAVLVWDGPRSLRRLSWAVLAVCTPALVGTLTRAPILATIVVVVLLLLLGRARVLGLGLLAVAGIALVMMLPTLKETDLYRERVAEKGTVEFRAQSQDWSLRLAAQKPVLGWGYGSFDRVKNASGFHTEGIPIRSVLEFTSHNSFLTILVELGGVGLLIYLSPFLILGFAGVNRARAPAPDRWLVVASLGCLLVILLTAATFDTRFFSFALMLPFVYLAMLRRAAADSAAQA